MINTAEYEISAAHKDYNAEKFRLKMLLKLSDFVFILLINVEMPSILTFMSRMIFMLIRVEHEKAFIASWPAL